MTRLNLVKRFKWVERGRLGCCLHRRTDPWITLCNVYNHQKPFCDSSVGWRLGHCLEQDENGLFTYSMPWKNHPCRSIITFETIVWVTVLFQKGEITWSCHTSSYWESAENLMQGDYWRHLLCWYFYKSDNAESPQKCLHFRFSSLATSWYLVEISLFLQPLFLQRHVLCSRLMPVWQRNKSMSGILIKAIKATINTPQFMRGRLPL